MIDAKKHFPREVLFDFFRVYGYSFSSLAVFCTP